MDVYRCFKEKNLHRALKFKKRAEFILTDTQLLSYIVSITILIRGLKISIFPKDVRFKSLFFLTTEDKEFFY